MGNLSAVILAAGHGVRMNSTLPKVLHKIIDKPMVQYVVDAAKGAGAEKIILVVGHKGELVKESVDGVLFATQEEQLGTGHAVMMAKEHLDDDGEILILYGDSPLLQAEGLREFVESHRMSGADATLVSAIVPEPYGYGRIIREKGMFKEIVEEKDLEIDQRDICEINTGVYCFKAKALRYALSLIKNDNAQQEYYLTDALSILLQEGYGVGVYMAPDIEDFHGINNRVQLAAVAGIMKRRINEKHMLQGVTIMDPGNTYIGSDVSIGMDTIIYPGTVIEGHTVIGKNCVIGANCRIANAEIGDNADIQQSVITDAKVGPECIIGPFAYLRPKTVLGRHVKVGDFVEIKNAVIGDNTKANHLTYIGDAQVGSGVNFGCGTVIVNYDGNKKHKTVIEDNTFIGCNSNLISPVTVHEGAYIAAGSTITDDVPEKSLGIARARQVNKEGWIKKDKK